MGLGMILESWVGGFCCWRIEVVGGLLLECINFCWCCDRSDSETDSEDVMVLARFLAFLLTTPVNGSSWISIMER